MFNLSIPLTKRGLCAKLWRSGPLDLRPARAMSSHRSKMLGWLGRSLLVALVATSVGSSPTLAQTSDAERPAPTNWTSHQGVAVEADFVRMTENAVVLKMKRDGKEVSVPLTSLSIDSIYQAVRLANPAEFAKPVPKAEVKPEVTVNLPELNLDVNELLKSPFASSTSIEQFFQTLTRASTDGNFLVGWHALPPKMQSDLEDVIIQGHQALGPSTVKQIQVLLTDLNTILRDKQAFIRGLPDLQANPLASPLLDQGLSIAASLVEGLANEQHWQASNFQKGNVLRWLAQLNVDTAPAMLAIVESVSASLPPGMGSPLEPKINILSQSADSAEVEISTMGQTAQKSTYQKMGNIWIDVQAMNKLRTGLDAAKQKLSSGAGQEVGLLRSSLVGLIAAVGGLARANSQEEFNEAVELLKTLGGGFTQSLNLGAGPGGGPAAAAGGRGRLGRPIDSSEGI